jgi:hypothetical protein
MGDSEFMIDVRLNPMASAALGRDAILEYETWGK